VRGNAAADFAVAFAGLGEPDPRLIEGAKKEGE
jgi:hypothetical protein